MGGIDIARVEDYESSSSLTIATGASTAIHLPASNVLKYVLEDGSWFCVRPSGTEPKVKFYFGVVGKNLEDSESKLKQLQQAVMTYMEAFIN